MNKIICDGARRSDAALASCGGAGFSFPGKAVIDAAAAAMGTAGCSRSNTPAPDRSSPRVRVRTRGAVAAYTVKKYTMSVNYAVPAMRQELVRIDDQKPPRGGGAGGYNPVTFQGGIRPIPGDIIQNQNTDGRTEVGALHIWLTPHGFLKGAAANAATAKGRRSAEKRKCLLRRSESTR